MAESNFMQNGIWNPQEKYNLDPATGQYTQQPPLTATSQASQQGTDWGSVESQLRDRASQKGLAYDPSDLEGIQRHTGYNEGGQTLEQALQNQYGIYDQRAATQQTGGGDQQSQQQTSTGPGDWYKSWFENMRSQQAAQEAERKQKADSLYNTWLGRSQQALNIDRNDPIIRQQSDAYRTNEERARRNYISDQAEAAGPLANLRGEERMAAERVGQRTGSFEAQLVGRELQTRRDEIAQALLQMGNQLSQDQQVALQRELGILDQAIRERGLDLQSRGLDQDWQRALLSNNQFLADLGLRAENQYNYWNDPLRTR